MGAAERGMLRTMENCIETLAGKTVAGSVMEGSDEIARTSDKRGIAEWVEGAMERLDASTDEKTRIQIMVNCGYNCAKVNNAIIKRAKARRTRFKTIDEFLAAEQRKPLKGTRLVREKDVLYQFYTPRAFTKPMRCYCSLLRDLPPEHVVSRTYCHCSKGFVTKYWEALLDRPVKVDIIQSAISGADECKFAIHL
jgi:hypothetical protein